jgi:hypothetical protein
MKINFRLSGMKSLKLNKGKFVLQFYYPAIRMGNKNDTEGKKTLLHINFPTVFIFDYQRNGKEDCNCLQTGFRLLGFGIGIGIYETSL